MVGLGALLKAEPPGESLTCLSQGGPSWALVSPSAKEVITSLFRVPIGDWARQASVPHVSRGSHFFTLLFSFRMKKAGNDLPLRPFQGTLDPSSV